MAFPQLPIAGRAKCHAHAKARGFTLLEILIVLLLLLALAALVIPAAAAWLGNVQSDQVRQQVVELIKDELLESMRSRQPRVLWVSSKPLAGSAATPAPGEPAGAATAADLSDSARIVQPAQTVRWVMGCRPLSGARDPGGISSGNQEPKQLRSLVDLPRGWLLTASVSAAEPIDGGGDAEADDGLVATAAQPGGLDASASTSEAGAGAEITLDSGEPAQVMILWPSGQIDVLIPIELTEPDGRRWKLDLNPWTLAVQWVLVFTPADQAGTTKGTSDREPGESEERQKSQEPAKQVPSTSDATPEPSAANKDAQERDERDQNKSTKPDDQNERAGDAAPR